MITILSALVSLLSFRVRSRASLELEVVALRHQVAVLRRQRPGRLRLFCADRLLWIWLYRIWPQALHAMVLAIPATVLSCGYRLDTRAVLDGDDIKRSGGDHDGQMYSNRA
jgi:putative transposase